MKKFIKSTSINTLFMLVNNHIKKGYRVNQLYTQSDWRIWRWVTVYVAELQLERRLDFAWGPAVERPIPQGPEFGDCDVRVD